MRKILSIFAISLAVACADNVAPGTLNETIRRNDSERQYVQCMQQNARIKGILQIHCKKQYALAWANWHWEDCVNEGVLDCGDRPRYEDMK